MLARADMATRRCLLAEDDCCSPSPRGGGREWEGDSAELAADGIKMDELAGMEYGMADGLGDAGRAARALLWSLSRAVPAVTAACSMSRAAGARCTPGRVHSIPLTRTPHTPRLLYRTRNEAGRNKNVQSYCVKLHHK